ncbi:hypothetical protein Tco_0089126 [Tanacetum coccineum]
MLTGNDVRVDEELWKRFNETEINKEKDVEKVVDQNLDKHEAVKDNKVSNEIDDVPEKGKDVEKVVELGGKKTVQKIFILKKLEMNKEKDVEKVVHQNLDKPEYIKKESEFGNNEVEKNTKDLIKGADVCVEISKKEVSKGVLAIYEEPLKDSESQTSIFDSQPEDTQHETQDSQPGMEIGAGIQEENHEPVKKADFPSIGLEDIESLKGSGRNLFAEKTTVQNVNEDDMILQDSLLNLSFLSTQEVSCLEIDTQKSPQIQKQGLQEESPQIQKQGIPKSFHSNKLKLPKYVSLDAQAILEKRQEDMLTKTRIFHGKETKTFDSIKSKLVKKNDGMTQCMKEKSINEEKGKSDDFKGGHPTVKRQQIKKGMEGEKNVPKTRAKKIDAYKQDIKKPQVRKQTAAQLAKLKETKAKTVKPAPTKRKKKEPNDKEETAIHASPISFIPPPVDIESEKRQGKPSNFLVSPFNQRKVILHEPVSEEGKKIVEYIWSDNTPEGDNFLILHQRVGIECVFFLSLYPEIQVASTIIDLWTLVLNNKEQHKDKLSGDGNVYCHTVMMIHHSVEMGKGLEARRKIFDENIDIVLKQAKRKNFYDVNLTSEIEIINNIDNGIDDIKTRYGGFPYALAMGPPVIAALNRQEFHSSWWFFIGLLALAIDAACAFRAEEMPSLLSCRMAAKVWLVFVSDHVGDMVKINEDGDNDAIVECDEREFSKVLKDQLPDEAEKIIDETKYRFKNIIGKSVLNIGKEITVVILVRDRCPRGKGNLPRLPIRTNILSKSSEPLHSGTIMSSSPHSTIIPSDSDVENTFSSTNILNYFPASPGNISPNSSDDFTKYLLDILFFPPLHDDPYIQAYDAIPPS